MIKISFHVFALAGALLFFAAPVAAKTHALIVGINSYATHRPLKGAVNDARDLADVLQKLADGSIATLFEEQATRANFLSRWNAILRKATPGDVVIVSFAGHGIQVADDPNNLDEEDGSDEALIFQPFDEKSRDDEILLDDEIFELFQEAEQRELTIFFIADACHSGGVFRSIARPDIASEGLPHRFTRLKTRPTKTAVPPSFKAKKTSVGPRTVFASATIEQRTVQEIQKGEKPRGALSYAVARGIEGAADFDRDGVITAAEMTRYVTVKVREDAANRQVPEILSGNPSTRLITVEPSDLNAPVGEAIGGLPEISLAVNGKGNLTIDGARIVNMISDAELVWDEATKELTNPEGDILTSSISRSHLPSAVSALRLKKLLLKLQERGHLSDLELLPDDRLYREGDEITFRMIDTKYAHIIVFNISASGKFQYLYPMDGDPLTWDKNVPWQVNLNVQEPFGADSLVIISSEKPLTTLQGQLIRLHCKSSLKQVYAALSEALPKTNFAIGLKTLYTEKKEGPHVETSCS